MKWRILALLAAATLAVAALPAAASAKPQRGPAPTLIVKVHNFACGAAGGHLSFDVSATVEGEGGAPYDGATLRNAGVGTDKFMDLELLNTLDDEHNPNPELWAPGNWSPFVGPSLPVAWWWHNEDYGRTGTPVATGGIYTLLFTMNTATSDGWGEHGITNAYWLDQDDQGLWSFHADAALNWRRGYVGSWETSPESQGWVDCSTGTPDVTYGDRWVDLESCWVGPDTDGFVMWDEESDTQVPCEFTYPTTMTP